MSLPERVGNDWCGLARRWVLEPQLAQDVVTLDEWAAAELAATGLRWGGLYIISGRRTPAEQAKVNPFNPNSLHVRCPSLAVDLRLVDRASTLNEAQTWAWLGSRWEFFGNRWGGRFKPPDINHFDLGKPFQGERPG